MRLTAFTLIEVLIAVALALVIGFTAFSGFRVASKTFTTMRTLSRENAQIVNGYFAGMQEADRWYALDDPTDTAGQQLRKAYSGAGAVAATGGNGVSGQPFVPLTLPPEYWNWKVNDERHFVRTGWLKDKGGNFGLEGTNQAQVGCVGFPDADAAWLHQVNDRLYMSLGHAAYNEYLPNYVPWSWYLAPSPADSSKSRNSFGVDVERKYDAVYRYFYDGLRAALLSSVGQQAAIINAGHHGMLFNGLETWLAPRPAWALDPSSGMAMPLLTARQCLNPHVNYGNPKNEVTPLRAQLSASTPMFRVIPQDWPTLWVGVQRFIGCNKPLLQVITVEVSNGVNGGLTQLRFHADTTTLRGARQLRMLANWGDGKLDQVGSL